MKPHPLESLFLFFGAAGCLVLLSGCCLVLLYLLAAHRPQPGVPAAGAWDNDALVMDGFLSGWPVRLLMVLLGGSLLVVACFRWAGLTLAQLLRPATHLSVQGDPRKPQAAGLFPWD